MKIIQNGWKIVTNVFHSLHLLNFFNVFIFIFKLLVFWVYFIGYNFIRDIFYWDNDFVFIWTNNNLSLSNPFKIKKIKKLIKRTNLNTVFRTYLIKVFLGQNELIKFYKLRKIVNLKCP